MPKQTVGWIKLYRQMIDWCWYKDPITKAVFLHLLLEANSSDKDIFATGGIKVERGCVATSYRRIAEAVGITYDQSRTAISHLKSTGDITVSRHPAISIISIENYERYQVRSQGKSHSPSQSPSQSPIINKNNKEGVGVNGCRHTPRQRTGRDSDGVKWLDWSEEDE